jgi:hypothetical protein
MLNYSVDISAEKKGDRGKPLTLNTGPQCKGGFQVFAPSGVKILFPVKYTDEIKDESRLDFTRLLETVSAP